MTRRSLRTFPRLQACFVGVAVSILVSSRRDSSAKLPLILTQSQSKLTLRILVQLRKSIASDFSQQNWCARLTYCWLALHAKGSPRPERESQISPRNSLLVLAAQIAEVTRPKVFLVENVAGAQSGSHKKYWNRLQRIMAGGGYKTTEFSLRGIECGVPQLRRRSIFLAWRTGGQWPATLDNRAGFTLRDALSDLEGVDDHEPVITLERLDAFGNYRKKDFAGTEAMQRARRWEKVCSHPGNPGGLWKHHSSRA